MINVNQWMKIPQAVRVKIAKDFNLERTGRMGVANNVIVSDGYTQNDILKINLLNLQKIMDSSEENFDVLFEEYKDLVEKTLIVIEENIMVDMGSIEEFNPGKTPYEITVAERNEAIKKALEILDKPLEQSQEFNPNVAPSGDTETYFGAKIKPVTYKPNEKNKNKGK